MTMMMKMPDIAAKIAEANKNNAQAAEANANVPKIQSQTITTPSGAPLMPGQKDVDGEFAKTYTSFANGGGEKNLQIANNVLDDTINGLKNGTIQTGRLMDRMATDQGGHQNYIGKSIDPQSNDENIKQLTNLKNRMAASHDDLLNSGQYFQKNGTLAGYGGNAGHLWVRRPILEHMRRRQARAKKSPRKPMFRQRRAPAQYGLEPGLFNGCFAKRKRRRSFGQSGAKGEQGLFQFMPATAKAYGIDPTDPDQSAIGAARMLSDLKNQFGGDTASALAAYNWGSGNVEKHGIEAAPDSTKSYVSDILGKMGMQSFPAPKQRNRQRDKFLKMPIKLAFCLPPKVKDVIYRVNCLTAQHSQQAATYPGNFSATFQVKQIISNPRFCRQ
ncbi:unnamed protein product [Sphagnum balticum]